MKSLQAILTAFISVLIGWAVYNAFNAETDIITDASDKDASYQTSVEVIEARIKRELEKDDAPDFKAAEEDIARLLRKAPLNDDGLFYHAQSLIKQKDWQRFDPEIFSTIQSRNPRNRKNLRTFLNHSVSLGNWSAVLEILDRLYRLERDEREPQIGLLSTIYTLQSGQAEIDKKLAENPSWGKPFIDAAVMEADGNSNAPLRKSLLVFMEAAPQKTDMFKAAERLIRKTLGLGLISEAYNLWQDITALSGGERLNQETLNYNAEFARKASPPPFNWVFPAYKGLIVDFETQGIFISFLGDQKRTVASQYYIPKSGPTTLSIKAQYNYNNRQGMFSVNTRCLAPVQAPFVIALDDTQRGQDNIVQTLPSHEPPCELAVLHITAQPGVFSERITANFQSISVTQTEAATP